MLYFFVARKAEADLCDIFIDEVRDKLNVPMMDDPPFTNYLRTLPIHHSQKEVKTTPNYADFEFYLRPTFDFRQELLS